MPVKTISLNFPRLPLGVDVESALALARGVQEMRSALPPLAWAAVERLALAVLAEAAVDRSTAEQVVRLASRH